MSKDKRSIITVRFHQHMAIGKQLDQRSYLARGESVVGIPVEMSWYDATFMRVDFKGRDKVNQYTQLVPWTAVSTVIFEE